MESESTCDSPDLILRQDEMERPRTPRELAAWVRDRMEQFSASAELKHYFRLRKGLCQPLCEELAPFSVACDRIYGVREDVLCIPCIGSQPYDARTIDNSTTPSRETFVEITFAVDGHQQSMRMEALNATGHVAMTGPVSASGTRRQGRKVSATLVAVSSDEIIREIAALIVAAIRKKVSKGYPEGYVLVVGCDDALVREAKYADGIEAAVREALTTRERGFSRVLVAGAGGRLFFEL